MDRYETKIEDGTFYIESDEDWLEVGEMANIYEIVGGESYILEYDKCQRTQSWLDTNKEGQLTFDVRETLERMDFDVEFVQNIAGASLDETDESGYPHRTSLFADLMMRIWNSKGNLELERSHQSGRDFGK